MPISFPVDKLQCGHGIVCFILCVYVSMLVHVCYFPYLNLLFKKHWNLEVYKLLANFKGQYKYSIIFIMCYKNLLYQSMGGSYWQFENNIILDLFICIYYKTIHFSSYAQFVFVHQDFSISLSSVFLVINVVNVYLKSDVSH